MSLAAAAKLGPYEVVIPLGASGCEKPSPPHEEIHSLLLNL